MQALVIHAAKDLRLEEQVLQQPGPGQVLVRVERGGICGSDLHYFNHGGFGTVRLKEPMILGHEVAGIVERLGQQVEGISVGDGEVWGKRVLVTGSGPIGALCVISARRAGAAEIVVTDIADFPLSFARKVGADRVINTALNNEALTDYGGDKGYFDIQFECSGSPVALAGGIGAVRPRGVVVQVGLGGDMTVPVQQQITAKELELRGSFRFHEEFATAVALMQKGLIDVKPLITHTLHFEQAGEAFALASDRQRSMKVQLQFA